MTAGRCHPVAGPTPEEEIRMPDVIGAIREKWLALGGEGALGPALDVERPTFDGVGRAQAFARGAIISWHPAVGAFSVWGGIGQKWQSLDREQYGYPITDESACPDGIGRFNTFRSMQVPGGPLASIYWTPRTGAHEIHGGIRARWASIGFERSALGYPTSDEHGNAARRRNDFEHGFIDWDATNGAQTHIEGAVLIDD
jgi:uncharacterized protein with LGFP repeats